MSIGCCDWAEWLGEQVDNDAAAMRRAARRVRRLSRAKRLPASTRAALGSVADGLQASAAEAAGFAREWSEFEG